jgi:magnesium transporter
VAPRKVSSILTSSAGCAKEFIRTAAGIQQGEDEEQRRRFDPDLAERWTFCQVLRFGYLPSHGIKCCRSQSKLSGGYWEVRSHVMRRIVKKKSQKAGLPPGTLVHIGDRKMEKATILVITYDQNRASEIKPSSLDEHTLRLEEGAVTWLNVTGVHDLDLIQKVGKIFDLHPLLMEDIVSTDQRPKMEDYGKYAYLALKMLQFDKDDTEIVSEQVSIIFGKNYVLTFQEREGDVFQPVRERISSGKGRIRNLGSDYLAYALVDAIVDNYFIILERIGEHLEELADAVVATQSENALETIHDLKRELVYLRKAVWPLREAISGLYRSGTKLIAETTGPYLRDVYDHTIQIIDAIESFRDLLSGMLDIYLSNASNKLNQVMKVLTIIATIFIPLTFITGIYGMNFKYMPELEWRWGYVMVWLVMVGLVTSMLILFRRKRWL